MYYYHAQINDLRNRPSVPEHDFTTALTTTPNEAIVLSSVQTPSESSSDSFNSQDFVYILLIISLLLLVNTFNYY